MPRYVVTVCDGDDHPFEFGILSAAEDFFRHVSIYVAELSQEDGKVRAVYIYNGPEYDQMVESEEGYTMYEARQNSFDNNIYPETYPGDRE